MSGRSAVRKGKAFERAVASAIREALPGCDAHRGQQSRDGADAPDVTGLDGFWVETKHRKAISAEAALRQAQEAARGRAVPVAVLKRHGGKPYVAIALDDFLDLVARLRELERW